MTNEAEKRAVELANAYMEKNSVDYMPYQAILHEYIQHVSDVAEQVHKDMGPAASQWASLRELRALILPNPVDDMHVIANKLGVTKQGLIDCVEAEGYEIRKVQP